jgi:hypothetical protein
VSTLIHVTVIVFCIWLLLGALPQMRRDAAAKVPQVRGLARERMRAHAATARTEKRARRPEWWGWTAAWAAVATAQEGTRFGGYLVRSAWRGWGEHRRRAQVAGKAARAKWFPPQASEPAEPADPPSPPLPPEGGTEPPGGGGTEPPSPPEGGTEPPREEEAAPPQPAENTPEPELVPVGNVIPFNPGKVLAEKEGAEMSGEINNLEAAVAVVREMQRRAAIALDNAIAEKQRTAQSLIDAEQSSNDLAAAGVTGPAWEAFVRYHEAVEVADNAAASAVTACELAVQAADSARGALVKHEEAAEQLKATGGAANETQWYGASRTA